MANDYAARAAQHKIDKNWRTPEGDYLALLKDIKVAPAQSSGKVQVVCMLKPVQAPTAEVLAKMTEKDRKIKLSFAIESTYGFNEWIQFMIDCGLSFESCRSEAEDPKHADLIALFKQLEMGAPLQIKCNSN